MQQHTYLAALGAAAAVYVLASSRIDAFPFPESTSVEPHTLIAAQPTAEHRNQIAFRTPAIATPNLIDTISAANDFFISQYRSPFNQSASTANGNCGPACLAMAVKRFFPDETFVSASEPERLVRLSRLAMMGNTDESINTDNDDVIRGAAALGLRAERAPDLSRIDEALDGGAMAIVSGSPSVSGSFGQRLFAYRHCSGGHFIALAGKRGDKYLMCDPESLKGTEEITRAELAAFLSYWPPSNRSLHGAVALYPAGNLRDSTIAELERRLM